MQHLEAALLRVLCLKGRERERVSERGREQGKRERRRRRRKVKKGKRE